MAGSKANRKAPPAGPAPRPRRPRRRWYQGPLPIVATVLVLAAIVAALVLYSQSGGRPAPAPSASAAADVVAGITSLDQAASLAVGPGSVKNPLKAAGAPASKDPDGRVPAIYVGAEYCPYCAAERWSLVIALSRFGSFSGLALTRSSSTDIYPDTATFTFTHATFSSSSVNFTAFETADRTGQPLQQPSSAAQQAMSKHDPAGSIPFLDIAGTQYEVGAAFVPDAMTGLDWSQILAQVRNNQSPLAQQVIGTANWFTAGLCRAGAVGSACSDSHIQALEGQLGG